MNSYPIPLFRLVAIAMTAFLCHAPGAFAATGDGAIRVALLDETRQTEVPDVGPEETLEERDADEPADADEVGTMAPPVVDAKDKILPVVPLADAVTTADEADATLQLLGATIPPGTARRLAWSATELFEGVAVSTPVLVVNGVQPGPTLCLSAAIHGDELNGIEIVRRVMHDLNPEKLSGSVIGIPIVNLQGFRRGSRYLPDRRDLNRFFPGNAYGSAASRIANSFFSEIVLNCDALIDLHTGSFERRNLPQLRANLRNPDVVTLTQGFGATVILHSSPGKGTLRYAATEAGVPTVTLEAGGPLELELNEVNHGVKGIETLLHRLGMVKRIRLWGDPEPVYYKSSWVRATRGGILLADISLGSTVRKGDLLGTITDPMNNASTNLYSPFAGRIIGMARNQVVMPGFAAFHIGIASEDMSLPEPEPADPDTEQDQSDEADGISE
ncbi:MAG: succinylglutamate desuccinylase/aspartoacylase family protein [Woeseia sp.]|nr:succinylglutamate desuccinylase/aspartoacylase family protein [Woeseia sp.]